MSEEQLCAVQASGPVRVRLTAGFDPAPLAAMGIGSMSEGNPQRLVMQREELTPASLQYLQAHPHQTELWLAHLYQQAPLEPLEIQPFLRPLRGLPFLFSMLGELTGLDDPERFPVGEHWPLSCLDRERAFCLLLERLRRLWQEGYPDDEMRLALLADYASRLRQLDNHSFVCWDNQALYAYSDGSQRRGLFYELLQGEHFLLQGVLPLEITAESPVSLVLIGTDAMLSDKALPIQDGQLSCFSQGQLQDTCEPVQLWS
ncbi:class II glutamine amidotransferase [Pontibacter sp. JAM-7]|uniref:class II glutamine amidotransferase n=1 Tax=Pontibacter sp. JAM-7 TaxID=3366581 RepID=UPI003AF8EDF0